MSIIKVRKGSQTAFLRNTFVNISICARVKFSVLMLFTLFYECWKHERGFKNSLG